MNKIIVTGATSMIGISIIEACLKNNVSIIYAVVRPNTTKLYRIPKDSRIHIIKCDIDEYENLPKLINGNCDVFYHIAWSATGTNRNDDVIEQSKNIEYTLEALKSAKKLNCKKFIGAGSQAEYGRLDIEKISEASPINPVQSYGIAKYAAGKLGLNLAKKLEIDFIWVRIFSIYGPYDKSSTMIASTIQKLMNNEPTSFTLGEQRWDFLYSSDAGNAFYLIGEKSIGNNVYCLGSGEARQLKEYIITIGNIVNPNNELGIGKIPYSKDQVMNLCADITKLKSDTGWYPIVTFEDGIKSIIEYINEEKNDNSI